jgi:hypothetical protein
VTQKEPDVWDFLEHLPKGVEYLQPNTDSDDFFVGIVVGNTSSNECMGGNAAFVPCLPPEERTRKILEQFLAPANLFRDFGIWTILHESY